MNSGGLGRHLRLLFLLLALLGATATIALWPTAEPVQTAAGSALRVQLEPTDEPGGTAADELTAQIQAMRGPVAEPVFHHRPDGSVSADLGRRFLKMSVATVDAEGDVHISCVDGESPGHQNCGETSSAGREQ